MKFNELACTQENGEVRSVIDMFIHKLIGEDLSELKIPSNITQPSSHFSLPCLESTIAHQAAWIFPFFSAVWRLFSKIVLLRYSPRVGDRIEQDVQIQFGMTKFCAKMHVGKGKPHSSLARYDPLPYRERKRGGAIAR